MTMLTGARQINAARGGPVVRVEGHHVQVQVGEEIAWRCAAAAAAARRVQCAYPHLKTTKKHKIAQHGMVYAG